MLLPKTIDPIRIAKRGSHLSGQLLLNQCARLQELCDQAELQANVQMDLNMDTVSHVSFIRGQITTTVNMMCQRCNQPMACPLDISFLLGPVLTESDANNLPKQYEPLIVKNETVLIADMIEDEILLALPMVVRHEEGCG